MRSFGLAILTIALGAAPVLAQGPGNPGWKPRSMSFVNHEVQVGETLFGIAERYYGDGYRFHILKEYNSHIGDPDRLVVGTTIFVPNPTRNVPGAPGKKAGKPSAPGYKRNPKLNGGASAAAATGFQGFIAQIRTATFFGRSLINVFLMLCGFFIAHAIVQGSFVWFAAHLSFVKNVSFSRAMRATVQAEGLASVLLVGFAITALALVYVGTAPPGQPALDQLLTTVEGTLSSSTGMMVAGVTVVALYCFLGIRFIPGAFEIPGAQGISVVFLAILIPHAVAFYLLGARLGLFGTGAAG